MLSLPSSVQKLIRELSKLPSVGEKTATRLAYFLINTDKEVAISLSSALEKASKDVRHCSSCFFLSDKELCDVCSDPLRDKSVICVVEKPMDILAIERMAEYKGSYHVLHGVWAPLRGDGPEKLKLQELIVRIKNGGVREVILATGCTVEGDATALYVARLVNELGVKCTRLAQGMPKGGELEFADDVTLSRAMNGRSVVGM